MILECQTFLLGEVSPDPVGQILGAKYSRFSSPYGVDGLGFWTQDRLNLLAVHARAPGRGQFHRFIADAKCQWKTICVWEVWNEFLGPVLERYGFTPEIEIQPDGEVLKGFRWDRKAEPH